MWSQSVRKTGRISVESILKRWKSLWFLLIPTCCLRIWTRALVIYAAAICRVMNPVIYLQRDCLIVQRNQKFSMLLRLRFMYNQILGGLFGTFNQWDGL